MHPWHLLIATSQRSLNACDTDILHLLFGKEVQFSENRELFKYGLLLSIYPTHTDAMCVISNVHMMYWKIGVKVFIIDLMDILMKKYIFLNSLEVKFYWLKSWNIQ